MTEPPSLPQPAEPMMVASDAMQLIADRYGLTLTPQTFYNWIRLGRYGHKLVPDRRDPIRFKESTVVEFVTQRVL